MIPIMQIGKLYATRGVTTWWDNPEIFLAKRGYARGIDSALLLETVFYKIGKTVYRIGFFVLPNGHTGLALLDDWSDWVEAVAE